MSQYNVTSLTDLTDRPIAAGDSISSTDNEALRNDLETRIANLNDAAQAIATCQSGASLAVNRQGELFFDTDVAIWYGDPDGSGHDDEFATRLKAYLTDFATAGTATFRMGGPLDVNTTDSAKTTAVDFAETYTLPANTLNRNGQYVHVVWYGTRSAAAGTFSLEPYFGSAAGTAVASTINSLTNWVIEMWVIRTGVGTQDFAWYAVFNSDATASTTLCDTGTLTEDETGTIVIKLKVSAISAGTVTQSGMITEFGNY